MRVDLAVERIKRRIVPARDDMHGVAGRMQRVGFFHQPGIRSDMTRRNETDTARAWHGVRQAKALRRALSIRHARFLLSLTELGRDEFREVRAIVRPLPSGGGSERRLAHGLELSWIRNQRLQLVG